MGRRPCYGKSMLAIDVFSDVVCPWCYLGTERLAQTLRELGIEETTQVRYRPFLLQPDTPPEGVNIHERLRRRYGDLRVLLARVEGAARESGLALDLTKQPMSYPTAAAHTLLRHAAGRGTQRALARALFRAYFDDARDISDPTLLAEIAGAHGFEPAEAARLAADESELAETRREATAASERGITGVPFFVFNDRFTVSGAQSTAVLRSVIEKAQAMQGRAAV